ncbi:hypothetical protein ONJ45_27790, partial [Salmonella enterica subsp. enterica serovar Virginia]|nr:hypothetical protein [Salmonella enterica subsp. enterica serovar Virginia]
MCSGSTRAIARSIAASRAEISSLLNAALSLCACAAADENHRTLLEAIQQQLFWFSAELASDSEQP